MNKRISNFASIISAFIAGLIFGLGLILAGMANPSKVQAFLDLDGLWDPSLGLVMGGAIAVGFIAFKVASKRSSSFLGLAMQIPSSRIIDKRLLLGGIVFGIGWGLVGICPAPAFVLLGTGSIKGIVFLIAMLVGMGIFELIESRSK